MAEDTLQQCMCLGFMGAKVAESCGGLCLDNSGSVPIAELLGATWGLCYLLQDDSWEEAELITDASVVAGLADARYIPSTNIALATFASQ